MVHNRKGGEYSVAYFYYVQSNGSVQPYFEISMGNPNPRRENLIARARADESTEKLASQSMTVKLFASVDIAIRSLPNRSAWLRRVITEAAQRELMQGDES